MNAEKALQELQKIAQGTFTEADLKQMISFSLTLSGEAGAEYFKGIIGSSTAMDRFCEEWIAYRAPPSRSAAWTPKKTGFTVLQEIAGELYELKELQDIYRFAKSMESKERDEYFKSLLGPSDKVERMLLMIIKEVEKEQGFEANKKDSKKSKTKVGSKIKERVGNAPNSKIGREICECMATVHSLVTNCLGCGKIVCAYEGHETCPECNTDLKTYTSQAVSEFLLIAKKRQETLLAYDSNSAKRTQVIDVAADYDYKSEMTNRWLTDDQRQLAAKKQLELEQKQDAVKKSRVITLDIANKKVITEKPLVDFKKEKLEQDSLQISDKLVRNPNLSVKPPEYRPTDNITRKPFTASRPISQINLQDLLGEE